MFRILLLVCFLSVFRNAQGCDDGVATIVGKTDFPPLSWQQNGKLDGIAYVTMAKIMKEKGIELKVQAPMPWKRALQNVKHGKTDFVVTVRETENRRKYLQFVPAVMMASAQNVFYGNSGTFNNLDDLKGKRGGVTLGLRFTDEFSLFAKQYLTFSEVPKLKQNILKLEGGRIDFFISPMLPTLHYIQSNKVETNINYMLEPLFVSEERVAISKASSCLKYIDFISKRLNELNDNGFVDSLLEEELAQWSVMTDVMVKVNESPEL